MMNKLKSITLLLSLVNSFFIASIQAQDIPAAPELSFAFEVLVEVADPTVVGLLRGVSYDFRDGCGVEVL